MHKLVPGMIAVILSFTVQAQKFEGKQKDIDRILAKISQFSQYYIDGAYRQLAECYTPDGKIMPQGPGIIEGIPAIEQRWTLPEGVKILKHVVSPVEIKVIKKTAYDYGYYEGETLRADGEKVSWKGKYVIVWKKIDRDWKIYLDIWNRVDD